MEKCSVQILTMNQQYDHLWQAFNTPSLNEDICFIMLYDQTLPLTNRINASICTTGYFHGKHLVTVRKIQVKLIK